MSEKTLASEVCQALDPVCHCMVGSDFPREGPWKTACGAQILEGFPINKDKFEGYWKIWMSKAENCSKCTETPQSYFDS